MDNYGPSHKLWAGDGFAKLWPLFHIFGLAF